MKILWQIRYWGSLGQDDFFIFANNDLEAIQLSHLPASCIVSVRRSWSVFKYLWARPSRLSQGQQLMVLLNVQANCMTGNFDKIIAVLLAAKSLQVMMKKTPEAKRDDISLSKRLTLLQFDPEVCASIENGEKTGRLVHGIEAAINYLQRGLALNSQTARQFQVGLALFTISTLAFFIVPSILSEALRPFLEIREINFPKTIATDFLISFGGMVREYYPVLLIFVPVCIGLVVSYGKRFGHFPPFSLLQETKKIQHSIDFLAGWTLYKLSGMALETDRQALCRILGQKAGQDMSSALEKGESLPDVITKKYFSDMLVDSIHAMNQFDIEKLEKVSDVLIKNLSEEQAQKNRILANLCYGIAAAVSLSLILILAYGMIFPMLGSMSGLNV